MAVKLSRSDVLIGGLRLSVRGSVLGLWIDTAPIGDQVAEDPTFVT